MEIFRNMAGERKTVAVSGVEYAFRWCPPGSFLMGSPEKEEHRDDDETAHLVELTRGFWMLETEVTQAMFQSIMACNPSTFRGEKLPVNAVSMEAAEEFCAQLNSALNNPDCFVTLPTEAQWEYACRAGTSARFGDENEQMCNVGWSYENSESQTHAVAEKKPNAWGLYDMHGNVWEWCQDWYDDDYPPEATTDPVQSSIRTFRALRGGSWNAPAGQCRAASRLFCAPECGHDHIGFRIVLIHR
ncbi:MAG: formylglycine-generating enzyme family protein [Thermoguttaceae bacterium]|nr:formylglycine-generating enzyme family protein [Thermoguttaceae bacterium]